MEHVKKPVPLLLISLFIAIFIFLKNAWVCEDAYIIFRSIEQLFAGNGPVWNSYERVQICHPLWYVVLAFVRIFSNDVYLNVIIVSGVLWLSTILVLKATFKNNSILLIAIILFSASNAFYDYTSSGLPNILGYFFIAFYILNYLKIFIVDNNNSNQAINPAFHIKFSLIIYGLIICVRHDLAPLLLPATIYIVVKKYKSLSIKQWVVFSIIAFLPFSLYSLFSLIYYGFPFPNTAYAKLNTGIANKELFKQGFYYFYSTFKHDTITILVIIATLVFNSFRSSEKCFKYLAYGVILNLFYVFYVGGDFMQGRFLSYAYMVSAIVLLLRFNKVNAPTFLLIFIAICSYLVFYQHTPFNSPVNYRGTIMYENGITDARGLYFKKLSLYRYITRNRNDQTFPNRGTAPAGYKFKESSDKIMVFENIGQFGYYSGTEKIIIDPLALSDPLLARMPVSGSWSIGHFIREIPAGYVESVMNGNEVIINPGINKFYKKLKIVTQNESLFTLERLKTIMLFNIGAYDHLLLEK